MNQDKNWNKMAAVPPVKRGLCPPVDRIKTQLDANQQLTRKPFPWKLPEASNM